MAWYAIVVGVLLAGFGRSHQIHGMSAVWVGLGLIGVGLLALAGTNVFYGGPLDMHRDKKKDPEAR